MITAILTSAIQLPNDIILTMLRPKRHHDIINTAFFDECCDTTTIQGFLAVENNTKLVFLDRQQALKAAEDLGMKFDNRHVLFSEDLY